MTDLPAARSGPFPLAPYQEAGRPALFGLDMPEHGESLIRQYWRMLIRYRWIIASIVGACLLLALIFSMLTTRLYTATIRLEVAREAPKIMKVDDVEASQSGLSSREFYETQYALLRSRSLSEAVVRDLRLADNYMFLANNREANLPKVKALPRDARFKMATALVNGETEIVPVKLSSVVDIRYTAADPQLSASIANAVAENFIETSLSRRFEATSYARKFLQERLDATRTKLEESERRAADYAQKEGLIKVVTSTEGGIASEQTLTTADLAQLSTQLAMARAQRAQAEADFRASNGGGANTMALNNVGMAEMRAQRATLSGELSKLESDFGPDYPKVQALRSQVRELDRQIASEMRGFSSSVSSQLREKYQQALAAERGLQARVDGLKGEVLDQQQRSIQFNIIQRDVDTNRALYEALLQRFKEIGVAGGVGANNVSIIDRAVPPSAPSKPNIPFNLTVGLFLGLMIGVAVAFVLEQLADSVLLPTDFQRKLGVNLLGSIPRAQNVDVLDALDDSRSELSEAYFSTLTSLQFSTPKGTPSTLLFTSSQPAEGKSTTSYAMARALASVGSRVLLIDGDMRNPSLHRILGRPLDQGLSDVLAGRLEVPQVVRPSGNDGLDVMFAGPIPTNPAELLAAGQFENMINKAASLYDHVVVDGPPVIGLADAPQLARSVEGTVFVVESGRTRATQARQALERLKGVRANILGAVLAKLDAKAHGYGYGYGYQYRYGTE